MACTILRCGLRSRNMLGAGVFGFMINPPISLFYLQGLNTTAVHSHAALFGVYGFLALGFILLVMRYIRPQYRFNDQLNESRFWGLNLGSVGMIVTSLLPIGIYQACASMTQGLWYARSEGLLATRFPQKPYAGFAPISDLVFIAGGCKCGLVKW